MSVTTMRPPADFWNDVTNPQTLDAETRFMEFCMDRGWTCIDCRGAYTEYDFEVDAGEHGWQRVDVKCDRYFDDSERIVFEIGNTYPDGSKRKTWGASTVMTWLAVVAVPSWTLIIVDLAKFRRVVAKGDYKRHTIPNRLFETTFCAVPLDDIQAGDALVSIQPKSFWWPGQAA